MNLLTVSITDRGIDINGENIPAEAHRLIAQLARIFYDQHGLFPRNKDKPVLGTITAKQIMAGCIRTRDLHAVSEAFANVTGAHVREAKAQQSTPSST